MKDTVIKDLGLNMAELRAAIQEEYSAVALNPEQGFHFYTGHSLAHILAYPDEWINAVPKRALESLISRLLGGQMSLVMPPKQAAPPPSELRASISVPACHMSDCSLIAKQ